MRHQGAVAGSLWYYATAAESNPCTFAIVLGARPSVIAPMQPVTCRWMIAAAWPRSRALSAGRRRSDGLAQRPNTEGPPPRQLFTYTGPDGFVHSFADTL